MYIEPCTFFVQLQKTYTGDVWAIWIRLCIRYCVLKDSQFNSIVLLLLLLHSRKLKGSSVYIHLYP